MEPEVSLPYTQQPAICPYPEPYRFSPCPQSHFSRIHFNSILPSMTGSSKWPCSEGSVRFRGFCDYFVTRSSFYRELLAPRPAAKLEDHPLSFVRDCLFNIFAAILPIRKSFPHPQPEDVPRCGDRDPLITVPCRADRDPLITVP
jgi:hypothetical protein